jgi:hypothetical protein
VSGAPRSTACAAVLEPSEGSPRRGRLRAASPGAVGRRLKRFRTSRHWGFDFLARLSGVAEPRLRQLENGKGRPYTHAAIARLARSLSVSQSWLLYGLASTPEASA